MKLSVPSDALAQSQDALKELQLMTVLGAQLVSTFLAQAAQGLSLRDPTLHRTDNDYTASIPLRDPRRDHPRRP